MLTSSSIVQRFTFMVRTLQKFARSLSAQILGETGLAVYLSNLSSRKLNKMVSGAYVFSHVSLHFLNEVKNYASSFDSNARAEDGLGRTRHDYSACQEILI
jgi:hypothetical protein